MKSLLARLLGLTQAVVAFYTPVLKQLVATGLASLLPVALDIVRGLADAKIPNDQKFSLALNRLKETAELNGIAATESLLRYTVESAVQRLKAE